MAENKTKVTAFLNNILTEEFDDAPLNTEYYLCPEMDEVALIISDFAFREGMSKDESGENEKPWVSLTWSYEINDDSIREDAGLDKVYVRSAPMFLKFTKDGRLDKDNNQPLARRLQLLDIDTAGKGLGDILEATKGKLVTGKITHNYLVNKEKEPLLDDNGQQRVVAEVTSISV